MTASNDAGWNPVFGFLAWLVTVALAAGLAAIASADAPELYARLVKPEWAPPASIFGPAWMVLYFLMAMAAWLVWRDRGFARAPLALGLFLVQLVANALWSWLFFAWRQGLLALVDIVVLAALIVVTIAAFWRIRPLAGALLLPYLAWVVYAAVLNYRVWQLNPDLLP
ncbi:MAG: tryptophan-rich sensory protein [Betaproteobacteria bacterium]|nr:tryptophan-rich sensory protein [Betaproteobacteria bacterium]